MQMKHVRQHKNQINLDGSSAKSQLPLIFKFGQTQGKESCTPQTQSSGHLPLAPRQPTKTRGKKTLSMHSIIRSDTYHIWVKRGCNLLINEIIPVNWGEEDVILNLHLLRERKID